MIAVLFFPDAFSTVPMVGRWSLNDLSVKVAWLHVTEVGVDRPARQPLSRSH
jgi:hypothetical protein